MLTDAAGNELDPRANGNERRTPDALRIKMREPSAGPSAAEASATVGTEMVARTSAARQSSEEKKYRKGRSKKGKGRMWSRLFSSS